MLQSYSGLSYVLRCYRLILGCLYCLDCLTCYSLILVCLTFLGVTVLFWAYSGLSYVLRCYSLILGLFWTV